MSLRGSRALPLEQRDGRTSACQTKQPGVLRDNKVRAPREAAPPESWWSLCLGLKKGRVVVTLCGHGFFLGKYLLT